MADGATAPSLISAGAKGIIQDAERLGLAWRLSLATVTGVEESGILVQFDGDTESIGAYSMIGYVTRGMRVYVITVPPSGNFIAGTAENHTTIAPGVPETYNYWLASITNASAVGTSLTPVLTGSGFVFKARTAYRLKLKGLMNASATTVVGSFVVTTPEHGIIWSLGWFGPVAVLGNAISLFSETLVRVSGGVDERPTGFTISMVSSSGTVQMLAAADRPRYFTIEEVGPAPFFPLAFDLSLV